MSEEFVSAGIVANGLTEVTICGVTYSGNAYDSIPSALAANDTVAAEGVTYDARVVLGAPTKTLALKDSVIDVSGKETWRGGVIDNIFGTLITENVLLTGGTSSGSGGAVYTNNSATIVGSTISECMASGPGGAIRTNGDLLVVDSLISNNTGNIGGSVYVEGGTATFTNVTFSGNCGSNGGAIYNAATVYLNDVTFTGNTAYMNGNAIYNTGTMTVNGAAFGDNQTIYNTGTLIWSGRVSIGNNLPAAGGGTYRADGVEFVFINTAPITVAALGTGNGGIASVEFNGSDKVVFDNGDLSAATISINGTLPTSGTLTVAEGITLAPDQAITVNGVDTALGAVFFVDGVGYTASLSESGVFTVEASDIPGIVYIDSDYTGAEVGYGYDKFASLDELHQTYIGYGGTICCVGGTYTTSFHGNGNLIVENPVAPCKFFGNAALSDSGSYSGVSKVEIAPTTSLQLTAMFGGYEITTGGTAAINGSSSVDVNGSGNINKGFVFGGHYLSSGVAVLSEDTNLTISTGNYSRFVCGGNIAVSDTIMSVSGNSYLTITGGVFGAIVAGGSYSQGGTITYRNTTITTNISGGTFNKRVFGGNVASKQSYAQQDETSSTLIDIKGSTTRISLNIDSSSSRIVFGSDIIAGSYSQGKITGSTNVKFTGLGSNLDFSEVLTGDSTSAGERNNLVLGGRNLTFDNFTGNFNAAAIYGFDTVTVAGDSAVSFTRGIDLSAVTAWTFELGSTLDWAAGVNNFRGDSLNLDFGGSTLNSEWTVISGADTIFTGWNGSMTGGVTIGGESAEWDNDRGFYASANYKLYCESSGDVYCLKVAAIA